MTPRVSEAIPDDTRAEREAFEAWSETLEEKPGLELNLARVEGGYWDSKTEVAWLAWLAAPRFIPVECFTAHPDGNPRPDDYDCPTCKGTGRRP
jgi:hypothetical protein